MPDIPITTTDTVTTGETPPEVTEVTTGTEAVVTSTVETPVEGEQTEQTGDTEPTTTLSPEDAVKEVTKVRAEAASWRTKFRDLEKTLSEAKTPEQVAEIVNGMTTEREAAERALVVENVALKHKLPEDLMTVLAASAEGKSREDLEAHATVLAKYLPSVEEDPDLQGGLRPGSQDNAFDALAEVQRNRRRRR